MVNLSTAEAFKVLAPMFIENFPQGALAAVVKGDVYEWVYDSASAPLNVFKEGDSVNPEGVAAKAMKSRSTLTDKVPASVYGRRLKITALPIEENNEIVGALIVAIRRVTPLAVAFDTIAQIISQVFSDGAFIYITSTEAFTHRYGDQRFDLPAVKVGDKFLETGVAAITIRERKAMVKEIDASVYGEVCLVGNFPLYDDEDPTEIIGTFGIATPKRMAVKVRNMSVNMHEGMSQIAAATEELAASAFEINSSEQNLNANVQEIAKLSEDINGILNFIKQIAEETKMLGLNAAIEAARAGEAGRGFGVVAEEIRKLSDESKETVSKIRGLTDQIRVKIEETIKNSTATMRASEEQAAATEEVTAQVEELNSVAEELDKIAQVI